MKIFCKLPAKIVCFRWGFMDSESRSVALDTNLPWHPTIDNCSTILVIIYSTSIINDTVAQCVCVFTGWKIKQFLGTRERAETRSWVRINIRASQCLCRHSFPFQLLHSFAFQLLSRAPANDVRAHTAEPRGDAVQVLSVGMVWRCRSCAATPAQGRQRAAAGLRSTEL